MSQPEKLSWGGARPGAGRKKGGRNRTPPELIEALSEIKAGLAKLTEQRAFAHQRQRNERESMQPILRRLTEIERHLRPTETPQAPRATRRHPMGV